MSEGSTNRIRVAFAVGEYPPQERKRREDAALAYASAEVEVGIVSVKATPYYFGNAPDLLGLAVPAFVDAFRDAERQGYDAVVPLGTLDLGVDAGRCVVDIPVVGPSESMLHIASMLGRRFGVIMYDDSILPLGYRMVERVGMMHKIVGWRTCGFELPDIVANREEVVSAFVDEARELLRAGADVILPMGVTHPPPQMHVLFRRSCGQGKDPFIVVWQARAGIEAEAEPASGCWDGPTFNLVCRHRPDCQLGRG